MLDNNGQNIPKEQEAEYNFMRGIVELGMQATKTAILYSMFLDATEKEKEKNRSKKKMNQKQIDRIFWKG